MKEAGDVEAPNPFVIFCSMLGHTDPRVSCVQIPSPRPAPRTPLPPAPGNSRWALALARSNGVVAGSMSRFCTDSSISGFFQTFRAHCFCRRDWPRRQETLKLKRRMAEDIEGLGLGLAEEGLKRREALATSSASLNACCISEGAARDGEA